MLWYLVTVAILLLLSAVLSGSETALFSLGAARRERLADTSPATLSRLKKLLAHPGQLLATILLSNLAVNIAASSVTTFAVASYARAAGRDPAVWLGLAGLAITGLLLVFGEVTPKITAARAPEAFVRLTAPFITALRFVLSPAVGLLTRASARLGPRGREPEHLSEDELRTMIRVGRERGVLVGREEEILWNLAGLEDRSVSEVMTPRIDIVCIEQGRTLAEAKALCRESGFSRLPVYKETVDNVVGTCYAKELLVAADSTAPVCSVCRPAWFVPETKRLPALLEELRRKGSHIAVVVDEFGQTAGLVTLEDVLEAIFGEISDEFDQPGELPWQRTGPDSYEVDGEIDTATLERLFHGAFDPQEHERLSSFVHERLGRLPQQGDRVLAGTVEVEVLEVSERKLERAAVRRVKRPAKD